MARMIPSIIDPSTSPRGEVGLFGQLQREAPPEWTVLHSLDLPQHVRQVEGEMDFLVLMPGLAAVCLEVKSHESARRDPDGFWRLGADPTSLRGPFRQAAEAMHSARFRLKDIPGLAGVPFVSAVAFPRCRFDVVAAEWEPWQVFDETTLAAHGVVWCLSRIANGARAKLRVAATAKWFDDAAGSPTPEQCDAIVRVLRPAFERSRSPKARRAEADGEIRRYTAEQFEALDQLEANRSIVFTGAAGTGKTFIAVEAARRAAAEGQRVLLCCYNRLLGQWMHQEIQPLGAGVVAGTLHSTMLKIAGLSVEGVPTSSFWATGLPAMAADALLAGHPDAGAYDLLVIDEAQDVCTPEYLDVLDLLVRGGLREGRTLAFGDFDHQSIYGGLDQRPALAARLAAVSFHLRDNCRNRPRIGTIATALFGMDPYARYRRTDDGVAVAIRAIEDDGDQAKELAQLIGEIRSDGYQLGDIAILSMSAAKPAWAALSAREQSWCADAGNAPAGKMKTSTIHAFKGLEAPAVIVTDIGDLTNTTNRQLLYVATTRATDRLAVCLSKSAARQLQGLVLGSEP